MSTEQPSPKPSRITDRLSLEGRTVVVAGAGGGGIGTQTTRAIAEAGGHAVAVDVSEDALAPTLESLRADGYDVTSVLADLRTEEGIATVAAAAASAATSTNGRVHGLVCIVGGSRVPHWSPSLELTRDQWHDVIGLNLDYVMFLSQAIARQVVAHGHGGSIVALSSTAGLGASPFNPQYGAAKAAIVSLGRTLATEWGQYGVRFNVVAPGTISTPRAGAVADREKDRRAVPLERRGRPDEIAAACLFLLSDLASYVTGQCLAVDGGASVKWAHLGADNEPIFVTNPAILERLVGGPAVDRTQATPW
jgi:3-oxoacyl-[acyl-carrier protein] reductase